MDWVKPGDSLSKIAALYKTSVAQIKQDNQLKSDKIFAGEVLSIHAPKTGSMMGPLPVKRAVPRPPSPPKPSGTAASSPPVPKKTAPPAQEPTVQVRSKKGDGKPLALILEDNRIAPWMQIAIREAELFAGKDEMEITKTRNYNRLVTASDRAGGKKTIKTKDGKTKEIERWDGSPDLGEGHPWCASFVNYCLVEAGYAANAIDHDSSFAFVSDRANFKAIKKPTFGAIRFSKTGPGEGHVCFIFGVLGDNFVALGGNQGSKLTFTLYPIADKTSYFLVPVAYGEQAEELLDVAPPEIELGALKQKYGEAVRVKEKGTR